MENRHEDFTMKLLLVLGLLTTSVFAESIEKKISFSKVYNMNEGTTKRFTLEQLCDSISSSPKLIINDLKEMCSKESMIYSSATRSSCELNSNQQIEFEGELVCVEKAEEFANIECDSVADCKGKYANIEGAKILKSRRLKFEALMAKLPNFETEKGRRFLQDQNNFYENSNCTLKLAKQLLAPIEEGSELEFPNECVSVLAKWEKS